MAPVLGRQQFFGYKSLSHKELAVFPACLARVNMLLFPPIIKNRSDCTALILLHCRLSPKGLDKNSPKGTAYGQKSSGK